MYFPNLILEQVCTHSSQDTEMTGCESLLRQLLAALVACLGAFSAGCGLAWPSVGLRGLKAESIELSAGEENQLVSIFLLAAAASPLPSGLALSILGRKLTLGLLSLPLLAGWLLLTLSQPSLSLLLIGRILTGFAGGAFLLVSTAYSEEVADPRFRGAFGSMAQLLLTVGILFVQVNCNCNCISCPACAPSHQHFCFSPCPGCRPPRCSWPAKASSRRHSPPSGVSGGEELGWRRS